MTEYDRLRREGRDRPRRRVLRRVMLERRRAIWREARRTAGTRATAAAATRLCWPEPTDHEEPEMTNVFSGQRPDITPAQVVGVIIGGVPVAAALLRAFGVYDASPDQEKALMDAVPWAAAIAGLLFASDAGVRAARNAADAKREAAALSSPVQPHAHEPGYDEDDLDEPGEDLSLVA